MHWVIGIYLTFAGLTFIVGVAQWLCEPKERPWYQMIGLILFLTIVGPFMTAWHWICGIYLFCKEATEIRKEHE
jgi:hypothetical protein